MALIKDAGIRLTRIDSKRVTKIDTKELKNRVSSEKVDLLFVASEAVCATYCYKIL